MPHLKYLFHNGRQKHDNTRLSAMKMLHQMSVWVVVVALRLVLITKTLVYLFLSSIFCPSDKSALGKWGRTQMGSDGFNRILAGF